MQCLLLLLLFSRLASGLYEEPPGGCSAPDFDVPVQRRKPPPPPKPPPPAAPVETPEESQVRMERELYERESAAQLPGLGGSVNEEADWEALEADLLRELHRRELLKRVAFLALCGYVLLQVFRHLQRLAKPAPPADASVGNTKEGSAAAPAPSDGASDAEPADAPSASTARQAPAD